MQITFKQGDSISIPEGCTAEIKDGVITFSPQQEPKQEFKDGDILIDDAKPNDATHKIIMIYKGERNSEGAYKSYILMNLSGLLVQGCCCWRCMPRREIRLATEEEKQELFDLMKEKGFRWNAAKKRVEKIRWRANDKRAYYFISEQGDVMVNYEAGFPSDEDKWVFGNYFRIEEQAEAAAEAIKEVLRKFHEEND